MCCSAIYMGGSIYHRGVHLPLWNKDLGVHFPLWKIDPRYIFPPGPFSIWHNYDTCQVLALWEKSPSSAFIIVKRREYVSIICIQWIACIPFTCVHVKFSAQDWYKCWEMQKVCSEQRKHMTQNQQTSLVWKWLIFDLSRLIFTLRFQSCLCSSVFLWMVY